MPLHVELCRSQDLCQRISLVEGVCFYKFGRQLFGHRNTRLIMLGKVLEYCRISSPMLIELGRELNEVARHRGAGETRIPGICKHAMERMAKLVKHGGDITKVEQRRLARGRFWEISNVVDDRKSTQQFGLAKQIAHPEIG